MRITTINLLLLQRLIPGYFAYFHNFGTHRTVSAGLVFAVYIIYTHRNQRYSVMKLTFHRTRVLKGLVVAFERVVRPRTRDTFASPARCFLAAITLQLRLSKEAFRKLPVASRCIVSYFNAAPPVFPSVALARALLVYKYLNPGSTPSKERAKVNERREGKEWTTGRETKETGRRRTGEDPTKTNSSSLTNWRYFSSPRREDLRKPHGSIVEGQKRSRLRQEG